MFGSSWGSVLEACRLGAEWAWRQVYEDVAPSLLRYHRARGTADPDDVVGDTFVRAVRGLSGFDGGEGEFRAWLFSISRNRAADLARAASRRAERPAHLEELVVAGGMGDVEDDALRALAEERIRGVLDELTPDQRDVLLLRLLEDLTIEQIAGVMRKSPGAVKALQARGLEQVRRRISSGAVTF